MRILSVSSEPTGSVPVYEHVKVIFSFFVKESFLLLCPRLEKKGGVPRFLFFPGAFCSERRKQREGNALGR